MAIVLSDDINEIIGRIMQLLATLGEISARKASLQQDMVHGTATSDTASTMDDLTRGEIRLINEIKQIIEAKWRTISAHMEGDSLRIGETGTVDIFVSRYVSSPSITMRIQPSGSRFVTTRQLCPVIS